MNERQGESPAVSNAMKLVLVVLALLVVVATALPFLRVDQWWIRVLDFPRGQIAVVGILLLALYLYYWDTHRVYESVVLGLLVLAVGYQVMKMFPYTVLMPKQVLAAESHSDDANLRLLVANVLIENRESEAFLDIVRKYDPDVILTVETDDWWEKCSGHWKRSIPTRSNTRSTTPMACSCTVDWNWSIPRSGLFSKTPYRRCTFR